jgi:hypothetical protein
MPMPVAVDNSLYEVRRYFFKPEDWAADGTKYLAWLESMFPVLSKTMDVVCFFGQDPAEDNATARSDVPAHEQLVSQITWVIRWDDYAHFEAGWLAMRADPAVPNVRPERPWGPEGYQKTEQRFMRAVGTLPRRLDYSAAKTYEVRNYTFGDAWTPENAAQYCQWAADEVCLSDA